MEIRVRKNSIYQEVIITEGTTTVSSGLLDKQEAAELAFQLESAAEYLSPEEE